MLFGAVLLRLALTALPSGRTVCGHFTYAEMQAESLLT